MRQGKQETKAQTEGDQGRYCGEIEIGVCVVVRYFESEEGEECKSHENGEKERKLSNETLP